MNELIPTRDRIMALLSPPSQDVHLTVDDARWIKAEIERLRAELKTCCDHENIWKHAQEMGYTKVIDEQKWEYLCQRAEIKRLEAEIYRKDKRIEAWKQSSDEHEERIERLRAVVDAAKLTVQHIPFCDDHGLASAIADLEDKT